MRTLSMIAILGCMFALPLSSCSSKKSLNITSAEWQLTGVRSSGESQEFLTPSNNGRPVTLTVTAEGMTHGHSGCNNFSGKVEVKKQSLTFGNLVSTRMFCIDGMEIEDALLNVLRITDNYEVKKDSTLLLKQGPEIVASFVPLR